jgi:phosphate transport system permease protein
MNGPVASAPPPAPEPAVRAPGSLSARTTKRSVLFFDKAAGWTIRAGGIGVIVALLGILALLVGTVIPLFRPASFEPVPVAGGVPVEGSPQFVAMDEHRLLGVAVGDRPEVVVFRPDDPREVLARLPIAGLEGAKVTTAHRTVRREHAVVGTADGRLGFLEVGFDSDFLLDDRLPKLRAEMKPGEVRTLDGGVVKHVAGGNLLRVKARLVVRGAVTLPGAPAVRAAGYAAVEDGGAAVAVTGERDLWVVRDAVDGVAHAFTVGAVAEDGPAVPAEAFAARVDEDAKVAWVAGRGGGLLRVDLAANPAVRREVKTVPGADGRAARLSAVELLIGGLTVLAGDETGAVTAWSLVRRAGSADGKTIERLHAFPSTGSPVTTIACSEMKRTFFAGHADGTVLLGYVPNSRVLGSVRGAAGPVGRIAVASGPTEDGLLVIGPGGAYRGFTVQNPHPEANFEALFQKVHYEGYDEPTYTYQSSAATQEAEVKLSLTPLLFGTLKGTFYAMLFALPLALLAAIYTSQFMHRDLRAIVKPGIEVMASLPSVVLGFLAALVLAPAIAKLIPAIFALLVALPVVAFVAGCAWHALPDRVKHGTPSSARLGIALALVVGTGALCVALRDPLERALFAGDFREWLRGNRGGGTWLLALALFAAGAIGGAVLLPRLRFARLREGQRPRGRAFVTALYALAPGLVLAASATWIEAAVFAGDFRTFLLGSGQTYDPKNSLVVGLAMGFAVIPIIYTIAEDALFAIPDSLKSAALACGASPWQTALRVVLPAAVPGVFSAAMIGLGRAIGETMIVVMATGGTAIMDFSPFSGFRTLSNNIATEMPEATAGGTLYRVLFLSGLLLFALTFVVNTIAEIVRIRFRRRFKAL